MKQDSRSARPASLDATMSRGWPALAEEVVDGWVCRFSGGVTKRANSVLPLGEPSDFAAALAAVEGRYADHGLPVVFQVSPDSLPVDLDWRLADRGYRQESPTLVQYRALAGGAHGCHGDMDPRIEFSDAPSGAWLETLWDVEGPHEPADRELSRRILAQTPSVYASLVHGGRVEAVARLALVGNLGGIYAVATRADARSRGHGRAIVRGLLAEASRRNLDGAWLQVLESNGMARGLYESMGFETVSRYHYRLLVP